MKLEDVEHYALAEMEVINYVGPLERMKDVLSPGWTWEAGG